MTTDQLSEIGAAAFGLRWLHVNEAIAYAFTDYGQREKLKTQLMIASFRTCMVLTTGAHTQLQRINGVPSSVEAHEYDLRWASFIRDHKRYPNEEEKEALWDLTSPTTATPN